MLYRLEITVPVGRVLNTNNQLTQQVRCSADCLPACTYTWYLASRRLDTGGDGRLMIEDLTRADAGTYTCHADNGVGRRRVRELRVDVECE